MNNLLKRSVFPAVKIMKKVKIKISRVPSEKIFFRPNKSYFQIPNTFGQLLRNTPHKKLNPPYNIIFITYFLIH